MPSPNSSPTPAPTGSRRPPLAVLGAPPAFAEPLHVGRPNIPDRARLLARIESILDRRWLTNDGPLVQELEQTLCRRLGVRHVVAMCNGTTALEIAIRALGLTGEVIVPSFTFVATAHALMWQEITPVFADIEPRRHHLDPAQIERMITPRTTGIIGVHLWGRPCDVAAIEEIGRRRGLKILFDAAHAIGCTDRGRPIGSGGAAEVFSFHATKCVNAFEGGAVATNDDRLADKMRLMRNFGFAGYDNVVYVGINGKMSEVSAAMGLTSLEDLEQVVARNQANFEAYRRAFAEIPGLRLLDEPLGPDDASNYQYVVVQIDERATGLTRDELVAVLKAENVLARRYFYPGCHRMEPYRSRFPQAGLVLPVTERVAAEVLVLPTGTGVSGAEIDRIAGILQAAIERAGEVRAALAL
ncbi:MAG: DegT/DnrJ/EryC1/StrS family aminotransferase [Planctomycetaceae bacterium]|nr:DegT/DnrJ/EryC1/StrS family aminotransferase [Planctomycetaceae bacterium]